LSGFSFCAPIPDGASEFNSTQDAPTDGEMPPGALCCVDDTSCATSTIQCSPLGDTQAAMGICPPNRGACPNETVSITYDSAYPALYNIPVPPELPPNSTCTFTIDADCGFPSFGNPNKTATFNVTVISGDNTILPGSSCTAVEYVVAIVAGDNGGKEKKEKKERGGSGSGSGSGSGPQRRTLFELPTIQVEDIVAKVQAEGIFD